MSQINILCSDASHLPLHLTFKNSGVAEKHGFKLGLDVAGFGIKDQPWIDMDQRAPLLLQGKYQFLSGLHHETYVYRARGDKRFLYLAQTQNDWDDRLIARPGIDHVKQLEGKKLFTIGAPCVSGNLLHALSLAGVDTEKVELIISRRPEGKKSGHLPSHSAVDMVARGEVDAASVDIPFDLRARKRGLKVLELPAVPVIHNTTICASSEFVRKNEESTTAFLKALVEAIHFFKTEKQKVCDILQRELAPLLHLEGDDEVEYLHAQWSRLLSAKPYPHPLAVWNVYSLDVANDPKVNFIGPLEIWDTHYLRMVDDSGFIDSLYGKPAAASVH